MPIRWDGGDARDTLAPVSVTGNVPLPAEAPVPLEVLRLVIAAGDRALDALESAAGRETPAWRDLDEALSRLSTVILRHIGLIDDEE